MKDPAFVTSPVYLPLISPKDSISTQRDDYFKPILSNDNFTLKSQLTSLYMHRTDYTFKLFDKNQDFFTSIVSKIMTTYHYWLDNKVKLFSLQFTLLRPSIYDLKTDENDPSFFTFSENNTSHYIHYISQRSKAKKLHLHELRRHITIYYDLFILSHN